MRGWWLALMLFSCASRPTVVVGSKSFTESIILSEIATQLITDAGDTVAHRRALGGTRILWDALLRGEIDVYPEYTGTLLRETLASEHLTDEESLRAALRRRGVVMSRPLGFNNTYALGMKASRARALGVRTISDLVRHPELVFGFSNELMSRDDGWPALRRAYQLPQSNVRGIDHDLAYRALSTGAIDVTDLYSTDAEVRMLDLTVLEDDRHHFPAYEAVWLWRADLESRAPAAVSALRSVEGRISNEAMTGMNARVRGERLHESNVAAVFLGSAIDGRSESASASAVARIAQRTKEHLTLVLASLLAAIVVSVPLGILAARRERFGQLVLAVLGLVQTIPSLALLVFMIPLLGIGTWPALLALFLYSLLPIVRNTTAGLKAIPTELRETADALGLTPGARLRLIELPLASRSILAGIKTSAVINVGTATIGALIGAGGYGQSILTGIRLDDHRLILEGAIPAAVLALLLQGLFDWSERWAVPKGLRVER